MLFKFLTGQRMLRLLESILGKAKVVQEVLVVRSLRLIQSLSEKITADLSCCIGLCRGRSSINQSLVQQLYFLQFSDCTNSRALRASFSHCS